MTTLVSNWIENNDSFSQNIAVYENMAIKTVRIHLFLQGTLTNGFLTLSVYDDDSLMGSKIITHEDINGIKETTYWHGMVSFEFDDAIFLTVIPSEESKEYTFTLKMENHTDDFDNSVSVCIDYEKYISSSLTDFRYAPLYGDNTDDGLTTTYAENSPITLELYELKR